MPEINLPEIGDPLWNLNPAIEAINQEMEEGRLSEEILTATFGTFVSVKKFGAVGDGETDDTEAIQAALDSGAKAIFFPAGYYVVSSIHVTNHDVTLKGAGWAVSRIVRVVSATTGGARYTNPEWDMDNGGVAVIEVEAGGFKLEDIAVKAMSASGGFPSHSGSWHDAGIRLQTSTRTIGGVTYRDRSLDADFRNVYLSGFWYGCFIIGQGFTCLNSMATLNGTSFIIDFPVTWCIGNDILHDDDGTADMRLYRFENIRTQANSGPLVTNTGPFAEKIMSLVIDGVRSDIGGEIFAGNLSRSTIRNFFNDQGQQTPVILLSNGTNVDFTIENFRILGLGVSDQDISANYPEIGIHATATCERGAIRDGQFINIGQYGIHFATTAADVDLESLYFENCGHNTSASPRGAVRFGGTGNRVYMNGIRLCSTDTANTPTSFSLSTSIDPAETGDIFIVDNLKRVGDQTSREAGTGLTSARGCVLNGTKTEAPVSGTWRRGDRVYNANIASGQPQGWVCTTAGTPGTWTALPNL